MTTLAKGTVIIGENEFKDSSEKNVSEQKQTARNWAKEIISKA